MEVDSFNPKHCARQIQVQIEYWKEYLVIVSALQYSSLEPYFCQFYLHRFRIQVLLPMDTQSISRRALKQA